MFAKFAKLFSRQEADGSLPKTPRYSVGGNGVVTVRADDILNSEAGRRQIEAARKVPVAG